MWKYFLILIVSSFLAGLAISLGGLFFVLISWGIEKEIGKVLGSISFSVGLLLVCIFKLNLYTGKVANVFMKVQDLLFYFSLLIMLIVNLGAAALAGFICYISLKNTDVMKRVDVICASRLSYEKFDDYLACMVKATFCGLNVALAVFGFNKLKSIPARASILIVFVFQFVYAGFEHCIANMFYLSFGNQWGYKLVINIVLCVLFNSLGAGLGVLNTT